MNITTVKELRTAMGMTQKAFGEYFDIPKRTLEDWEYGKNTCSDYLFALLVYKAEKEGLINRRDAQNED